MRAVASALLMMLIALMPISAQLVHLVRGHQVVDCCCGPHSVDEPCHCADCPAAIDQARASENHEPDDNRPSHPMFRPCGVDGEKASAVAALHWGLGNGFAAADTAHRAMPPVPIIASPQELWLPVIVPPS